MIHPDIVIIAGNAEPWRQQRLALEARRKALRGDAFDQELCALQVSQHQAGLRTATVHETIYGFSVRSSSGLDNQAFIPNGRRLATWQDAMTAGRTWAGQDPEHRVFFVWRKDLERFGS